MPATRATIVQQRQEMMFPRKSGHEDKPIVYNTTLGGI